MKLEVGEGFIICTENTAVEEVSSLDYILLVSAEGDTSNIPNLIIAHGLASFPTEVKVVSIQSAREEARRGATPHPKMLNSV